MANAVLFLPSAGVSDRRKVKVCTKRLPLAATWAAKSAFWLVAYPA